MNSIRATLKQVIFLEVFYAVKLFLRIERRLRSDL